MFSTPSHTKRRGGLNVRYTSVTMRTVSHMVQSTMTSVPITELVTRLGSTKEENDMSEWLSDEELSILPYWMHREYQLIRDSYRGTRSTLDMWSQLAIDHIESVYEFLSVKPESYQEGFRERFSNPYLARMDKDIPPNSPRRT